MNAVKKLYNIKVTKGFGVLTVNLKDSVTNEQVSDLIKWLNTVKIDKQIQQVIGIPHKFSFLLLAQFLLFSYFKAVEGKNGEQRIVTITFICAMTSTVVLSTLFSSLNVKHLNVDMSLDTTSSSPWYLKIITIMIKIENNISAWNTHVLAFL